MTKLGTRLLFIIFVISEMKKNHYNNSLFYYLISKSTNLIYIFNFLIFKDLITPTNMANDQDREELSKYCIWDATPKGATFMSINTNLYTIVSRTCEAAGLQKREI